MYFDLFFFTFSFVVCQNSCNFAKSNYEDLRMSSSMMIFKLRREVKNTPPTLLCSKVALYPLTYSTPSRLCCMRNRSAVVENHGDWNNDSTLRRGSGFLSSVICCRHRNIVSANNGAPTSVTSGVGACF